MEMDRQFILKNNDTLINLRKKIKGIDLGFEFIDLINKNENINELQLLSQSINNRDFYIHNIIKNEKLKLNLDVNLFQHQLQFFYRDFIEDHFFMNFCWYIKFSNNISNTLKYEFNYDSEKSIKFIIRMISNCFVIFSKNNNEYNFEIIQNYLQKVFNKLGLEYNFSLEFIKKILKNLEIYELIYIKKNIYGKEENIFLSDPYMDILFFVNSMFISTIYEDGVKYNPIFGLYKLPQVIDFYIANLENNINNFFINKEEFELKMFVPKLENGTFYDFSDLKSRNTVMEFAPEGVKVLDLLFYFNNALLNEYCFHSIINSCFDFYCTKMTSKNVLHLYKNYNYYLNP